MGLPSLGEIKDRKLVQWGVAYLAGAWVALQVVIALGGVYGWPEWLLRTVPVVLAVGFVGALVLAWYHGEQGRQRVSGVEVGVLAALFGVAGLGAAVVSSSGADTDRRAVSASGVRQVAVLPFANVGGDLANQPFIDGLAYTIGATLTELEHVSDRLSVLPTDDALGHGGRSPRGAAESLGADLVVSGSVQRAADRVRLTLEVYDARTDRRLGSRLLDKTDADLLALQDSVALVLADLLRVELTAADQRALAAGGTTSPLAFDLYTQARGALQNYEDERSVDRAVRLFRQALGEDDRYALAWAGLGEAYWRMYQVSNDPQWVGRAAEAGERAVALDGDLSPVRVTLGMIYKGTGRYDDAERELRRALALGDNAMAHQQLGATLYLLGRTDEAVAEYRRAIALKPGYWAFYNTLGNVLGNVGRDEEAVEPFRRVVELRPDSPLGYSNLAGTFAALGQPDSAAVWYRRAVRVNPAAVGPTATAYVGLGEVYAGRGEYARAVQEYGRAVALDSTESDYWFALGNAAYLSGQEREAERAWRRMVALDERVVGVNPGDEDGLIGLAYGYAWTGRPARARGPLRRLVAIPQKRPYTYALIARTYEKLGDRASALSYLKQGFGRGIDPAEIDRSPWLDDLRSDPRYARLVRAAAERR